MYGGGAKSSQIEANQEHIDLKLISTIHKYVAKEFYSKAPWTLFIPSKENRLKLCSLIGRQVKAGTISS